MRAGLYLAGIGVLALLLYTVELLNRQEQLEQAVQAHYTNELVNTSETISALTKAVLEVQLLDPAVAGEAREDVWRLSSELRNAMTKLPLEQTVANDFMHYFAKIGAQTKQGDGNWQGVAQNMRQLEEEWNVATARFLNDEASYATWQQQLTETAPAFQTLAKTVKHYSEADFPVTASESDYEKKRELAHIVDAEITKEQAVSIVKTMFPALQEATFTVSLNAKDAAYPFYHMQFVRGSRLGYADVTKKGGHLLSFLLERPTEEQRLSQQEARRAAEAYLQRAGYSDVTYVEGRENHEAWHFVYTRLANDALVYPDSIQLKVAKDRDEILGVSAMEYIQQETLPNTAFLPVDWTKIFAQGVQLEPEKKVYIENDAFELVAGYEVIVMQFGETFRVIVDAETHKILQMEQLV